jgi:hypothetical protein
MRKAINELCAHQADNGTLHSPIPGVFSRELPGQMLASVGRYGFWTYYMNTGDIETIRNAYPAVKRYLDVWETDSTGLTIHRKGGWSWGDWGDNQDKALIQAGWHYLALEGAASMAEALGYESDAEAYRTVMVKVAEGFNACWTGTEYRHPAYKKLSDDRVQALAVLAGIAGEDKYPQIIEFLKKTEHASPYFEKYVMEALFKMGEGEYAMTRCRNRFHQMVNHPDHTTLFEGWEIGSAKYGGGTTNHAWSGGAITVIGAELCGIKPIEPGYKKFEVRPQPAGLSEITLAFPSVKGKVSYSHKVRGDSVMFTITVPKGSKAHFIYKNVDKWLRAGTHEIESSTL